jgi:transcriptional repressor NrdR
VIKRDGTRVPYNRDNIRQGIVRAAYKRPISSERIEQVVDEVEEYLVSTFEKEVSSQTVGEKIAEVLRRVDKVAYVRFASVYRQFEDVGDFIDEAQDVIQRSAHDIPGQKNLFEGGAES